MTMLEIETDILKDLEELEDTISQYSYLIGCAEYCVPLPEEYRTDAYLIRECQVNTWVAFVWEAGRCRILADSEALLVKGALSLLQEIYEERTLEEVKAYHCSLLEDERFARHFSREQRIGFEHIINMVGE